MYMSYLHVRFQKWCKKSKNAKTAEMQKQMFLKMTWINYKSGWKSLKKNYKKLKCYKNSEKNKILFIALFAFVPFSINFEVEHEKGILGV